ncbi:hypothetical protein, partial [Paraferrimonas sp. SM1919]|uniref:hypothetical protein n=1 Tax=Paraferrimonas sp. SM1919 TaxID=2662263 RepID=UPI0013D3CF05
VQSFIDQYGDYQVEVLITPIAGQWYLGQDTAEVDTFLSQTTESWHISWDWEREMLLGSIDAPATQVSLDPRVLPLTQTDSVIANAIGFSDSELADQQLTLVMYSQANDQVISDLLTLHADGTVTGLLSGEQTMSWQVVDGVLEISLAIMDGEVVVDTGLFSYHKLAEYSDSFSYLVTANAQDGGLSAIDLGVFNSGNSDLSSLMNRYLMGAFTLSNPNAYDPEGNIHPADYFGYRLQTDGKATRIYDGNFDAYGPAGWQSGWDVWNLDQVDGVV